MAKEIGMERKKCTECDETFYTDEKEKLLCDFCESWVLEQELFLDTNDED